MRFPAILLCLAACTSQVDVPDDHVRDDGDKVTSDDGPMGDPAPDSPGTLTLTLDATETLIEVAGDTLTATVDAADAKEPLAYAWTSSRDGALATTPALSTSTLSIGDHTLSVTVTDASGVTGSTSVAAHILPRAFDWSHEVLTTAAPAAGDWMTSVKNQTTCGSCWSHAALGAMEARWNIQNGDPTLDIDLSEQWLIDCHHDGAVGCGGGAPEQALDYITAHGVPAEACDPFLGHNDTCSADCDSGSPPQLYFITARHDRIGAKADVQRWARDVLVHTGPIPHSLTNMYGYDAATHTCGTGGGDHYVVLVGYDHDAGEWIAKNSWGPSWNGNGYMRIKYGACGMDASATQLGDISAP